jgi:hypothetical protein
MRADLMDTWMTGHKTRSNRYLKLLNYSSAEYVDIADFSYGNEVFKQIIK